MAVRVEHPSQRIEERATKIRALKLFAKSSIKTYIRFTIGLWIFGGIFGLGYPRLFTLFFVGYIAFLKRERLRPIAKRWLQRMRPAAAELESVSNTIALPEPLYEEPTYGPDQPIWVGAVIPDYAGDLEAGLWLDTAMRNRHCYVIGKTRTGKTSLLKSFAVQDFLNGRGVTFVDPHGDAAADLVGWVPDERIADLIYFDPTDEKAPAFNPFALPYPAPKLAEDIVSVFRMLVGDSWGPRMEHLLRYGVLTLIADSEPRCLRDLRRLFLEEPFRREVVNGLENEQLRDFWELEFPTVPESAVNPILNKLSAFLTPMSHLERVFSQTANDLDFSRILDSGKIFLVNLAKGVLGEEPARLLGGLLVTGLQQAALARAARPAQERCDHFLTVDEFQNFTVASFESILAESAKYRLNLTLANQNLGQLDTSLQRAIFGNCGTLIAFQVSAEDAAALRKEMHRSRLTVRQREDTAFYTLQEFVEAQKQLYRDALADKYLGMDSKERSRHRVMSKFRPQDGLLGALAQGLFVGGLMKKRRHEMERVLEILETGPLETKTLAELFTDFEFRELSFPDVDDFLNCKQGVAFCRVGSAENVCAITFDPLPEPDQTRRDELMAAMAKRFARPLAPASPRPKQRDTEPTSFRE